MRAAGLSLALLGGMTVASRADYAELVGRFEAIRSHTHWPVQGGGFDDIEETFGPRRQPSNNGAYDWHRGIDIDGAHGRVIVAAADGEFVKYTYSTSGGWTVVLKHPFDPPVEYGGRMLTAFYTWYLHLDDAGTPEWIKVAQTNAARPAVSGGQVIGTMGNSGQGPGGAYAVHLHFELRAGTQSSLEFQLENYTTNSASFYGFDPHMHPLLLFPPLPGGPEVTRTQAPSPDTDGRYLLRVPNDDNPDLNRVEVRLIDRTTGIAVRSHVLDLNQRTGFDASTTATLDTRDLLQPYLAPLYFTDAQTDYQTELVVPREFGIPGMGDRHAVHVIVADLWGRTAEHPGPPALQMTRSGASIRLSWPTSHWGFTLHQADALPPGGAWSPVTIPPSVEAERFQVEVAPAAGTGYYRLRRP